MKVVAFLQNLWVKDPPRVKLMLEQAEARGQRECMLKVLLFHGGKTGQVLTEYLGAEWCNRIVWEESTRDIGGWPGSVFPVDRMHIEGVLIKHSPQVVIAFGRPAARAVAPWQTKFEMWECSHPTARGSIASSLRNIRDKLDTLKLLS